MKKAGARKRRRSVRGQVLEFHRVAGQPVLKEPGVPPDARVRFRLRLIRDEFFELLEASLDLSAGGYGHNFREAEKQLGYLLDEPKETAACQARVDLPEFADALADLDYVVEGSRLEFGIDGGPVADEVHRSNMAKFPGGVVSRRADGKILKPEGWEPPDLRKVLLAQGWKP
jgi:predicted HAD superfamily Cof-like phosphohydrolase